MIDFGTMLVMNLLGKFLKLVCINCLVYVCINNSCMYYSFWSAVL